MTEDSNKLWILYHVGFWDIPLSGVGIYGNSFETGQKVYFMIKDECDSFSFELADIEKSLEKLNKCDIPESVRSTIISLPRMSEQERELYALTIDGYYIEGFSNEISLRKVLEYDIFILEPHVIEKLDAGHKLFQEMVGHHTDHHPEVYKLFNPKSGWRQYYDNSNRPNMDVSPQDKKYLTTVNLQHIIWYNRPN